jgi:protein TonB
VLAAVFIAPIMADAELPEPAHAAPIYVEVTIPPLPPAARERATPRPTSEHSTANPNAAPVDAPRDIAPEKSQPGEVPDMGFENGSSNGVVGVIPGQPMADYVPPPPEPRKPMKVGGEIRPPRKIRDVAPQYPVVAQQARIEGTVVLEAVIGTDGRVVGTRILQSVRLLDDAAREAVSQWRFSPTLLNGAPVEVVMNVTVDFRLR